MFTSSFSVTVFPLSIYLSLSLSLSFSLSSHSFTQLTFFHDIHDQVHNHDILLITPPSMTFT